MLQLDKKSSKYVVKSTKGNIPIKQGLLNKYNSVKEIFEYENNIKNKKIYISCQLNILNNININNIRIENIKKIAYEIFCMFHNENIFVNDNNKILVSKTGINESIEKICNNYSQRELLIEHLKVFSKLGKIIENAKLVNQVYERKGRIKYNSWHYYINGIIINKQEYLLEFEVVSQDSGENHYRIQRIRKTSNHEGDVDK